jgi:hypothetical protein
MRCVRGVWLAGGAEPGANFHRGDTRELQVARSALERGERETSLSSGMRAPVTACNCIIAQAIEAQRDKNVARGTYAGKLCRLPHHRSRCPTFQRYRLATPQRRSIAPTRKGVEGTLYPVTLFYHRFAGCQVPRSGSLSFGPNNTREWRRDRLAGVLSSSAATTLVLIAAGGQPIPAGLSSSTPTDSQEQRP